MCSKVATISWWRFLIRIEREVELITLGHLQEVPVDLCFATVIMHYLSKRLDYTCILRVTKGVVPAFFFKA